jgi:hypothetical protein
VQLGTKARLAVQRAAQLDRGQLLGEDGAQRLPGMLVFALVFVGVDHVPDRHDSRSSPG